jgi:hypothetical protein
MEDITHMHSRFLPVATAIDNLGWDCFIEGRIPYLLFKRVQSMLWRDNPRGSVDLWGLRFIKSLISITHKQWFLLSAMYTKRARASMQSNIKNSLQEYKNLY